MKVTDFRKTAKVAEPWLQCRMFSDPMPVIHTGQVRPVTILSTTRQCSMVTYAWNTFWVLGKIVQWLTIVNYSPWSNLLLVDWKLTCHLQADVVTLVVYLIEVYVFGAHDVPLIALKKWPDTLLPTGSCSLGYDGKEMKI